MRCEYYPTWDLFRGLHRKSVIDGMDSQVWITSHSLCRKSSAKRHWLAIFLTRRVGNPPWPSWSLKDNKVLPSTSVTRQRWLPWILVRLKWPHRQRTWETPGWFELDPCYRIFSRISPSNATFPCTSVACAERILTATYSSVLKKWKAQTPPETVSKLKHGVPTVVRQPNVGMLPPSQFSQNRVTGVKCGPGWRRVIAAPVLGGKTKVFFGPCLGFRAHRCH